MVNMFFFNQHKVDSAKQPYEDSSSSSQTRSNSVLIFFFLFRFYWLKVRSLAESRNWLELERFSKTRKSLIGYEVNFLSVSPYNNITRECFVYFFGA